MVRVNSLTNLSLRRGSATRLIFPHLTVRVHSLVAPTPTKEGAGDYQTEKLCQQPGR